MYKELSIFLIGIIIVILPLFNDSEEEPGRQWGFVWLSQMIPRIPQINSSFKHSPASRSPFRVPCSGSGIRSLLGLATHLNHV